MKEKKERPQRSVCRPHSSDLEGQSEGDEETLVWPPLQIVAVPCLVQIWAGETLLEGLPVNYFKQQESGIPFFGQKFRIRKASSAVLKTCT